MKTKIAIMIMALCFYALTVINLLLPDQALSYSERRILRQAPPFTGEALLSGSYAESFDPYATDQFAFRLPLRSLKVWVNRHVFQKSDENGIFAAQGYLSKLEYPYHPESAANLAQTMKSLTEHEDAQFYFSIVPDKNYYLPDALRPTLDYKTLEQDMRQALPTMKYIRLFEALSLDDYYLTDSHWRQESMTAVVNVLLRAMDAGGTDFTLADYEQHSYYPFYGVYYGQAASMGEADTLVYLTSETTRAVKVTQIEYGRPDQNGLPVYDTEKLGGMDSYDVFLSGAAAIVTIQNEACPNNKELILFRDSFGSSIAPLLLAYYRTVTLVDLRYISTALVKDYIDFTGKDVLFLYSTTIINNSASLTSF